MTDKKDQEPKSSDSMLHVRTTSRQKAGWVKQAQREKLNLESWVTKTLDEAVNENGETNTDGV